MSTSKKILAFDLGTGGVKATLFDADGVCLAAAFVEYPTAFPQVGWHEQASEDWRRAVVESVAKTRESTPARAAQFMALFYGANRAKNGPKYGPRDFAPRGLFEEPPKKPVPLSLIALAIGARFVGPDGKPLNETE